jgi:TRAP-type C4-dicarboxylate transport system permease large subunit
LLLQRRNYAVWSTNLSAFCVMLCIFVSVEDWYLAGIFAGLGLFFYEISLTFVYAYLPEVGATNAERNKVSAFTVVSTNLCQLVLMSIIAGELIKFDDGT